MGRLDQLSERLRQAKLDVEEAEERLKEAKEAYRQLSEVDIPTVMDEMGVSDVTTANGCRLKLEDNIHARITDETREAAFRWLEARGLGGSIKRNVTIPFAKGEEDRARKLLESLGDEYEARESQEIHHSTLRSVLKQEMKEGRAVPFDIFNIHIRQEVKIKEPRQ